MARLLRGGLCCVWVLSAACNETATAEDPALPRCDANPVRLLELELNPNAGVSVARLRDGLFVVHQDGVDQVIDAWVVDPCGENPHNLGISPTEMPDIGIADRWLLRCDRETGAVAWVDPMAKEPDRPLLPASTGCMVVSAADGLAAVDPTSGDLWFHPAPDDAETSPRIVAQDVFVPEDVWCWTDFSRCYPGAYTDLAPLPVVASLDDALLVTHADMQAEVLDPLSRETHPVADDVYTVVPFSDPRWLIGRTGRSWESPRLWVFDRDTNQTTDLGPGHTWKTEGDWLAREATTFGDTPFEVVHIPTTRTYTIGPVRAWRWRATDGDRLLLEALGGPEKPDEYWLVDPIRDTRTRLATIDTEHQASLRADGLLVSLGDPHADLIDIDLKTHDGISHERRLATQVPRGTWLSPSGDLVFIDPGDDLEGSSGSLQVDDLQTGATETIANHVISMQPGTTLDEPAPSTVFYSIDTGTESGLWRLDLRK